MLAKADFSGHDPLAKDYCGRTPNNVFYGPRWPPSFGAARSEETKAWRNLLHSVCRQNGFDPDVVEDADISESYFTYTDRSGNVTSRRDSWQTAEKMVGRPWRVRGAMMLGLWMRQKP